MRLWSDRVIEEKNLFNPAFGAILIAEAINEFQKKSNKPLPFAVTFLVLPIVLHEATRDALPKSTLTALLPWVQDNREQLVGFAGRVQNSREISREAILFGLQNDVLSLNENGELTIGANRKTVTPTRTPLFTDEARNCVERSGFVGRWFAATGTTANIFSAWGVAP
ncbi:MAG: three component ABC system middle component [Bryobacteraceae bacterium]